MKRKKKRKKKEKKKKKIKERNSRLSKEGTKTNNKKTKKKQIKTKKTKTKKKKKSTPSSPRIPTPNPLSPPNTPQHPKLPKYNQANQPATPKKTPTSPTTISLRTSGNRESKICLATGCPTDVYTLRYFLFLYVFFVCISFLGFVLKSKVFFLWGSLPFIQRVPPVPVFSGCVSSFFLMKGFFYEGRGGNGMEGM